MKWLREEKSWEGMVEGVEGGWKQEDEDEKAFSYLFLFKTEHEFLSPQLWIEGAKMLDGFENCISAQTQSLTRDEETDKVWKEKVLFFVCLWTYGERVKKLSRCLLKIRKKNFYNTGGSMKIKQNWFKDSKCQKERKREGKWCRFSVCARERRKRNRKKKSNDDDDEDEDEDERMMTTMCSSAGGKKKYFRCRKLFEKNIKKGQEMERM